MLWFSFGIWFAGGLFCFGLILVDLVVYFVIRCLLWICLLCNLLFCVVWLVSCGYWLFSDCYFVLLLLFMLDLITLGYTLRCMFAFNCLSVSCVCCALVVCLLSVSCCTLRFVFHLWLVVNCCFAWGLLPTVVLGVLRYFFGLFIVWQSQLFACSWFILLLIIWVVDLGVLGCLIVVVVFGCWFLVFDFGLGFAVALGVATILRFVVLNCSGWLWLGFSFNVGVGYVAFCLVGLYLFWICLLRFVCCFMFSLFISLIVMLL